MESAPSADSPDIVELSNRLRTVRTACRRFILLWAMSRAEATKQINDGAREEDGDVGQMLDGFKNSSDPDWSFLYPLTDCDD